MHCTLEGVVECTIGEQRRAYGPAHSVDSLSGTWERARISNKKIRYEIREFDNPYSFPLCGSQESQIACRANGPLSSVYSISCRGQRPSQFTRQVVERIGQTHPVNSSERMYTLSEADFGKTALPILMYLIAITNNKFVSVQNSLPIDKIRSRTSKKKKNPMSENGMGSWISFVEVLYISLYTSKANCIHWNKIWPRLREVYC